MSYKSRLQSCIDSVFEPRKTGSKINDVISAKNRNNDTFELDNYNLNAIRKKSKLSKSKGKIMLNGQSPFKSPKRLDTSIMSGLASPFKSEDYSYVQTEPNNLKKLKKDNLDFSLRSPKKYNKPMITCNKVKLDLNHYRHISPISYKKNFYESKVCRNYNKSKVLKSIFDDNKNDKFYSKNIPVEKISFKSLYDCELFKSPKKGINQKKIDLDYELKYKPVNEINLTSKNKIALKYKELSSFLK